MDFMTPERNEQPKDERSQETSAVSSEQGTGVLYRELDLGTTLYSRTTETLWVTTGSLSSGGAGGPQSIHGPKALAALQGGSLIESASFSRRPHRRLSDRVVVEATSSFILITIALATFVYALSTVERIGGLLVALLVVVCGTTYGIVRAKNGFSERR